MHDDRCNVKHLIPNISNKDKIPLIPKRLQETHSLNKHLNLTNDPKLDPKRKSTGHLDCIGVGTSIFHICCSATSCITISRSPSSLQALTIVLSSERGDILIFLIKYSL